MNSILIETFPSQGGIATAPQVPSAPTPPSDAIDTAQSHILNEAIEWLTNPKEPTHLVGG